MLILLVTGFIGGYNLKPESKLVYVEADNSMLPEECVTDYIVVLRKGSFVKRYKYFVDTNESILVERYRDHIPQSGN